MLSIATATAISGNMIEAHSAKMLSNKELGAKQMKTNLEALLSYYEEVKEKGQQEIDMAKVIGFALFSTRRIGEITKIKWDQVDDEGQRILIKDMKGASGDAWCHVPDEAWAIMNSIPKSKEGPFPYKSTSIKASFDRVCKLLQIKNISIYDLRDEGITRLFEIGWDASSVASVSGHSNLGSMGKFTHLSGVGDKYKDWAKSIVTSKKGFS